MPDPNRVSYSFDPWMLASEGELQASMPSDPQPSRLGYFTSIPFEANGQVFRALPQTRKFGDYLVEYGRSMRTHNSRLAAREYDRKKFLDALRDHPMEFPHRVAQGVTIAAEAALFGRLIGGYATAAGASGSMFALPYVTSIAAQSAVDFGNTYNDLRDEGYPRWRAAARASNAGALSLATNSVGLGGSLRFGASPFTKAAFEVGDETLNELANKSLQDVSLENYYKGEPVEQISSENIEPVPVVMRDPDYVPAYAPRLGADYRVRVRRNPTPDPVHVPGGAYWRNAETGEAYYAERPVVRQNLQRDRWIDEQEALDYPYGW